MSQYAEHNSGDLLFVENLDGRRGQAALELLRDGGSFVLDGVRFTLGADGAAGRPMANLLRVSTTSSWDIPSITEDRARADLERGRTLLQTLIESNEDFKVLVAGRPIVLELVTDERNESSGFLLATETELGFSWDPPFRPHKP